MASVIGNSPGLQSVHYTYNIRGWLKQINDPTTLGTDLFAFKINYNTIEMGASAVPLYNGNISETIWRTANTEVNGNRKRGYAYQYDALNRLKAGQFRRANSAGSSFNEQANDYNVTGIAYDKNGNIMALDRRGVVNSSNGIGDMDKLIYGYGVGNKLMDVTDSGSTSYGFVGSHHGDDYDYDANGNMVSDANKGITGIVYNHLNLPKDISINGSGGNGTISYIYDATGTKLRKKVVETGKPDRYTYYAGNYVYEGSSLKYFSQPEGYVDAENGFGYVYQYRDHLGNIRLSYKNVSLTNVPNLEIQEENNYYPFGLEHKGYNKDNVASSNIALKRKFGGNEYQDELGLGWYDITARNYDPALGRWMNVDPLADERHWLSSYNYVQNNPLLRIDPTGMLDTHYEDEFGNTLADTNDGNNATVVVSKENSEAFKKDFENTSVMHQDSAAKNSEWIGKYGEGMIAQEGATVQSWAVKAMGHDTNYEGVVLSSVGLGMAVGENVVKGPTFRLFNNKGTNFSPRLYTSGWLGGSAGRIKTFGVAKTGLNVFGKFLGAYNFYSINKQYENGQISRGTMQIEQASNIFSTLGGIHGAAWGVGWELGKEYGPSKWYGIDNTKWFE